MSQTDENLASIKQKYVSGEITRKEYLKLKKNIEQPPEPSHMANPKQEVVHHHNAYDGKVISLFGMSVKPRFFVIVGGIIVIIVVALYLFLASMTPNHISSASLSAVPSFSGNGKSSYQIPFTLYSNLGGGMSGVYVQASTNEGSVNGCTTDSNGNCDVSFTPPKQATSSYANITLTTGSIIKSISIKVNPDPTARITLSSGNSNLPADGSSSTAIIVQAYDNQSSAVPDGTQITLSLTGGGSLSSTACITTNGECQVTYTSPTSSGSATISGLSYGATSSTTIILQTLNPSSISLSSTNSSINGNGRSTTTITAKVTNKLGSPVGNTDISFYTNEGNVANSCTTSSSGTCSVTYTSPNQAGQATINAYVYSNSSVSSSIPITLIPTTNLSVQFYANPDIGNPIVPAFALNYAYLKENMTSIYITNSGSGTFTGTVQLSVPGWSYTASQNVNIPPGSSTTIGLNPDLNNQSFSNQQEQAANYQLTITNSNGQTAYQNTYGTNITSFNTMDWFYADFNPGYAWQNNVIAAWVQPDAQQVHTLVSNAAKYAPCNEMIGYGQYIGCGGTYSKTQTTFVQLEAIWKEEQALGLHYVDAAADFSGVQSVYTPVQSLNTGGQNCIDGTLVFASAVSNIGMVPYIELVPGHAFVCVDNLPPGSSNETVTCIETTWVGESVNFTEAVNEGGSEYTSHSSAGNLAVVNVTQVLLSGVKSLPSS